MRKTARLAAGLGALGLALLPGTPAQALNIRSYLSSNGGGEACTLAAPCSSPQAAHDATEAGGEVHCLDAGPSLSIGHMLINKSITIDCHGGSIGAVVVDGGPITVKLRNVTVTFGDLIGIGVDFRNGAALFLENCVVEGFNGAPGIGVFFEPPLGITAKLHVTDSIVRDNGLAASGGGIIIQPAGSGSARVVVEHSRVENNTFGIFANGTGSTGVISVQVRDSVVANSAFSGISAFTSAGHSITSIVVDRSSSVLNAANGILAQGTGGFVSLTETTVVSNATGLNAASGGSIFSYQNNRLTGNVTDGAPNAVLAVK